MWFPLVAAATETLEATSTQAPLTSTPTAAAPPVIVPAPTTAPTPRRPVVVLDPGHMPETVGAVSADGTLAEHSLTLALAQTLALMLQQRGYSVYLTRKADGNLVLPLRDENGNGTLDDYEYLQPRTDLANQVGADVLISLHFNGSPNPAHSGTAVYYASVGPCVTDSVKLANLMQRSLAAGLRTAGLACGDWGALSDAGVKLYGTLYSLGQNPQFARPGQWPGVLIEPLFLTNADDAAFLKRPDALDVVARAVVRAIGQYFDTERYRRGPVAE